MQVRVFEKGDYLNSNGFIPVEKLDRFDVEDYGEILPSMGENIWAGPLGPVYKVVEINHAPYQNKKMATDYEKQVGVVVERVEYGQTSA